MIQKKLTGNLVKDNPKEARKRSSVPLFSKDFQPNPESRANGQRTRHARLLIQKQLEQTLEEMLQDPMTDTLALTSFISSMPKDKTIVQAITSMILRDAINPKTKGSEKMKLLETLIKTGYGDKMEISGEISMTHTLINRLDNITNKLDAGNNTNQIQES
jgi:hypothetical protein